MPGVCGVILPGYRYAHSWRDPKRVRVLSWNTSLNGELFSDLVQRYDRVRYGHFDLTTGAFDELRRLGSAAREAALGGAAA